jgi:hypothetical protein
VGSGAKKNPLHLQEQIEELKLRKKESQNAPEHSLIDVT